ncbi:hypothetical protein CBR_g39823 [Chara braunii]|uniref:Uncharacterized protein n=1 Tax=Chara braunii TaxID=69332 RepID=A0A388LSG3_CHABU|nr:hypothetical protein CBR_g39823 [Chara braunii]|eukprot:GBG85257.1 hypothetical protein CBR_g39823 [Chara braunii]
MSGSDPVDDRADDRRLTRAQALRVPHMFQALEPGEERRIRRAHALAAGIQEANRAAREQATAARAAAMANGASSAASSSASSSGTNGSQLGMPTSSTSSSGTSGSTGSRQSSSQMAGAQFSPLTPRERELREIQQVERLRRKLEQDLKDATDRENAMKTRAAKLETLEADKAELEGLDESALTDPLKVLKNNMLSLHAHMDNKLDFMQSTLDQILDALTRPGFRPPAQSPLPLSAMSGPFPVQAGTQPSGTSAAVSQTVASSSSGPPVIATSPQQPVPPQGQQQGLTPRERELREIQQVERLRRKLEQDLKDATDRENAMKTRAARLETLEADKAEFEGLDESALTDPLKVLKKNMLSLHAHVDNKLDFMQSTLDQILDALTRPRFRPPAQSPLPLSAMSGPFPVQAGTQPSGTSAAVSQTVASSSSGPVVIATSPQQPVPPQGQQQGHWYPKTPMKPPLPFSRERKDEELNTWLRTVPVWVKAKRTLLEDEVVTAASYLEGKAAKWLDGVVIKAGYGRRMADWAKSLTLDQFMEMVEARWHNPQEAQRAIDAINKLDQRKFKSVRELTTTVESLILVPSINYSDQFLDYVCQMSPREHQELTSQ